MNKYNECNEKGNNLNDLTTTASNEQRLQRKLNIRRPKIKKYSCISKAEELCNTRSSCYIVIVYVTQSLKRCCSCPFVCSRSEVVQKSFTSVHITKANIYVPKTTQSVAANIFPAMLNLSSTTQQQRR